MEFFQKKSNYFLFFCGLLILAVTPDRFTPQISAEPGLCYGIKSVFIDDPLWATLSSDQKQYIVNSPVRKAMWNYYLELRQFVFEQFVITLGLTKKEVTLPVKKIIHEAMRKGGVFFSPIDYPAFFTSLGEDALRSINKENEQDYHILFAQNGVITSVSSAPLQRNFRVNSSQLDQKNGSSLIAFNQLENFLVCNGIEVSDYGMTRVASYVHDLFKDSSMRAEYNKENFDAIFMRGCNSLTNNKCRLLLHVAGAERWIGRRLEYDLEELEDVDRCLAVINCLTLTPDLQWQLERCIRIIVQTSNQPNKRFKDTDIDNSVDDLVAYLVSNLQYIIKQASGYNANAIEFMKTSYVWNIAEFITWIDTLPLLF